MILLGLVLVLLGANGFTLMGESVTMPVFLLAIFEGIRALGITEMLGVSEQFNAFTMENRVILLVAGIASVALGLWISSRRSKA